MSSETWDSIATTWTTETQKWDVIDYSFTGTLTCLVQLNSAKAMGIAFVGTYNTEIEVNSPAEFPRLILDGTLGMYAKVEALVDYAIWVEQARVTRSWTQESSS